MKDMLYFLFCFVVAYTIFFSSGFWGQYVLENWGIRAFRIVITLECYAIMLVGYFAFRHIFNGSHRIEIRDFDNMR